MKLDTIDDFWRGDELSSGTKGPVFIGDDILVYRRDTKTSLYPLYLDLPGGGSEEHETPFETFKREVYEEFGLTITPESIVYTKRYASSIAKNKFAWFAVSRLPATYKKDIVFGDEGEGYFLMSVAEYLKRKDAWPVFQERTREFLANQQSLL